MGKIKADELKYAFIKSLPVLFGYIFLGIAFGILLEHAGFSFIWAFFISLFVFAGSLQFVLVTFLSTSAPLPVVAVMTLFINSRHIFYGLTFVEKFRKMGKYFPYMIFSLTDETYSLLCTLKNPEHMDSDRATFLIAALNHSYWIAGSVIGALLGQLLPFDFSGIEFSMTALFVVIFVEQWKTSDSRIPAVTGFLCATVLLFLLGAESFILPALTGTVAILMLLRPVLEKKREVMQ